jgi:hypothetical protein
MLTIRSRTTPPGSWADRRRGVGAIPADNAAVHPSLSASSARAALPAWLAIRAPSTWLQLRTTLLDPGGGPQALLLAASPARSQRRVLGAAGPRPGGGVRGARARSAGAADPRLRRGHGRGSLPGRARSPWAGTRSEPAGPGTDGRRAGGGDRRCLRRTSPRRAGPARCRTSDLCAVLTGDESAERSGDGCLQRGPVGSRIAVLISQGGYLRW